MLSSLRILPETFFSEAGFSRTAASAGGLPSMRGQPRPKKHFRDALFLSSRGIRKKSFLVPCCRIPRGSGSKLRETNLLPGVCPIYCSPKPPPGKRNHARSRKSEGSQAHRPRQPSSECLSFPVLSNQNGLGQERLPTHQLLNPQRFS